MAVVLVLLAFHGLLLAVLAANLFYLRRTKRASEPDEWPSLSVLVPARNEEATLPALLQSLKTQDYPGFETVVVDDASEDGTGRVLDEHAWDGLQVIAGTGPPPGWVGKVHALYQATRRASGDVYLFLDADAHLLDPGALKRLVAKLLAGGSNTALTGLPRYRSGPGGLLLTSLVPFSILSALPLPLVPRTKLPGLGALNGQCWLIRSADYHREEPHAALPDEILEDVQIGRLLKRRGMTLRLLDFTGEIGVRMYDTLGEAWQGFRKNAYLLQGGRIAPFLAFHLSYWALFVVAPWLAWPLLGTLYLLKGGSDLGGRLPLWVVPFAPLVTLAGALIQLDSAVAHWRGRVVWKGRSV